MDLQELLKNIHLIEIRTRKKLQGGLAASYRNVFRGQGMEFSEVREYVTGDDVRLIDWNVSARFDSLFVKQLMEERELNVIAAVQCSRSMDYGTTSRTKFQMAAELASTLIFSAIHTGDRTGLVLYGGRESLAYVPPKKGTNHGFILLNRLLEIEVGGQTPNLYDVLKFFTHTLKKRSVVFLIGDFIYSEWNPEILEAVSRRHDLICIGVLDPSEIDGPAPGIFPFTETGNEVTYTSVNKRSRQNFRQFVQDRMVQLETLFQKAHIDYLFLKTDSAGELELHRLFMERVRSSKLH